MANNLKAIRNKHGLTQAQLAHLMGTTKDQLIKLEQGSRRLTESWIRRASQALGEPMGIFIDESIALQPPADRKGGEGQATRAPDPSSASLEPGEIEEINYRDLFSDHREADHGPKNAAVSRRTWRVPVDFLRTELRSGETEVELVTVEGDAMAPTLLAGDRVMINRRQNVLVADGLYVIASPYGAQVKRLEWLQGTKNPAVVRVISDNRLHAPVEVSIDEVTILGRVVCRISRM